MRRIYFAIFGSGLGHVTRVLDIADRLWRDGDEYRYSCFSQGKRYLDRQGKNGSVVESPELDVKWTEDGSFSSRDFIPSFPLMALSFTRQVGFEAHSLSKFNPKVVVSDSRLSAVVAARINSHPIITILNQFKVLLPPRFRKVRLSGFWERIAGNGLGLLWSLSDQVLVTDLPPPYTIGEANIVGTDVSNGLKYVGFTTPSLNLSQDRIQKAKRVLGLDDRPFVFFQVSGPDATKKRFIDTVLESSDELSKEYNVVVSMGLLGGSSDPTRLANGTWIYEWCPIKDELFLLSDLIVARSGHRTIGECIDAAKPAVLVPIHNHPEQIANAEKFRKLGLGIDIRSEYLRPQTLIQAVRECMNDSKYKNNIENLRSISNRYNGIQRTVEIINEYS